MDMPRRKLRLKPRLAAKNLSTRFQATRRNAESMYKTGCSMNFAASHFAFGIGKKIKYTTPPNPSSPKSPPPSFDGVAPFWPAPAPPGGGEGAGQTNGDPARGEP